MPGAARGFEGNPARWVLQWAQLVVGVLQLVSAGVGVLRQYALPNFVLFGMCDI